MTPLQLPAALSTNEVCNDGGKARQGKARPQNKVGIEAALFGSNPRFAQWKGDFRSAYLDWQPSVENERELFLPPSKENTTKTSQDTDQVEDAESRRESAIKAAERKQRPAAYRFTIRGEEIDLFPEPPDPEDPAFARDTFEELVAKTKELHERLLRTNSAHRPLLSVERLLNALSNGFEDLRPGLLMSRVRSVEADQAAFDSEEARGELFADAMAMMSDTMQTARDLMAAFPIIRRIEAERLALDLYRHADTVPIIQDNISAISELASHSEVVTSAANSALVQNDAAISETANTVLRVSLVADKALVVRNFVGAVANKLGIEIADLSTQSWLALKEGFPQGVGIAARIGPLLVLGSMIAGPAGGIAAVLPAFKPVASLLKKIVAEELRKDDALPEPIAGSLRAPRAKRKPDLKRHHNI
jgi:hypothetical protein